MRKEVHPREVTNTNYSDADSTALHEEVMPERDPQGIVLRVFDDNDA